MIHKPFSGSKKVYTLMRTEEVVIIEVVTGEGEVAEGQS